MHKKLIYFLLIILIFPITTTFAHNCNKCKKKPSPWDGTNVLFGYIRNTGNTNSSNINFSANAIYKKRTWQNTFLAEFQYGKQDGQANRQYYHLNDQWQYFLNPKKKNDSFIFVNGDNVINRFGPYIYQMVYAVGYGRQLIDRKTFKLSLQAGPGYRRNKQSGANGKVTDGPILTTQGNASLLLGKWGTLSQSARFDWGRAYNYLTAATALTNKIWGHLAVQISYTINYYSQIPPSSDRRDKLDTISNVALVYNF